MEIELNENRGRFSNSFDFVLATISYAVGSFVYQATSIVTVNGGWYQAAVFAALTVLVTLPLIHLQLNLGQLSGLTLAGTFGRASPIFRGIGWAFAFVSFIVVLVYSLEPATALVYMVASIRLDLNWAKCPDSTIETIETAAGNNTVTVAAGSSCFDYRTINSNDWCSAYQRLAAAEFYRRIVRQRTKDEVFRCGLAVAESGVAELRRDFHLETPPLLEQIGWPSWPLVLGQLWIWLASGLLLCLGPALYGKMAAFKLFVAPLFFTVVVVVSLLTYGGIEPATALEALFNWTEPQAERIDHVDVGQTFVQLLLPFGLGLGAFTTLASFHRLEKLGGGWPPAVASLTPLLALVCTLISGFLWAGLNLLLRGHLAAVHSPSPSAHEMAFVLAPTSLASLGRLAPIWAFIYYAILSCFLTARLVPLVWTVACTIMDEFPSLYRHHYIFKGVLCVAFFLLSMTFTLPFGDDLARFLFDYVIIPTHAYLLLLMLLVVLFAYGFHHLQKDIALLLEFTDKISGCFWFLGPISPLYTAAWFSTVPPALLIIGAYVGPSTFLAVTQETFLPKHISPFIVAGLIIFPLVLILLVGAGQLIYSKCRHEPAMSESVYWPASRRKPLEYSAKPPLANESVCWCCCRYKTSLIVVIVFEILTALLLLLHAASSSFEKSTDLASEEERYSVAGASLCLALLHLAVALLVFVAARRHSYRLLTPYLLYALLFNAALLVYGLVYVDWAALSVRRQRSPPSSPSSYWQASGPKGRWLLLGAASAGLLFWLFRCWLLAMALGAHWRFRAEQPELGRVDEAETKVLLHEPATLPIAGVDHDELDVEQIPMMDQNNGDKFQQV